MIECFYCGRPLYETKQPKTQLGSIIDKLLPAPSVHRDWPRVTIDHIIPKSRGGTKRDPNNLVHACAECNQHKDRLTLEEYRVVQAFRFGYVSGVEYKFPGEK